MYTCKQLCGWKSQLRDESTLRGSLPSERPKEGDQDSKEIKETYKFDERNYVQYNAEEEEEEEEKEYSPTIS
jgi:hypothetical protein